MLRGRELGIDLRGTYIDSMAREEDREEVRRDWAFANNLVEGVSLEDV